LTLALAILAGWFWAHGGDTGAQFEVRLGRPRINAEAEEHVGALARASPIKQLDPIFHFELRTEGGANSWHSAHQLHVMMHVARAHFYIAAPPISTGDDVVLVDKPPNLVSEVQRHGAIDHGKESKSTGISMDCEMSDKERYHI
jgi:hypothetical protein